MAQHSMDATATSLEIEVEDEVEMMYLDSEPIGEDSFECNDESLVSEQQQPHEGKLRLLTRILIATMFLISIVLITVGISLSSQYGIRNIPPATNAGDWELGDPSDEADDTEVTLHPTVAPSMTPSSDADVVLGILLAQNLGPNAPCFDVGSYQWWAKQWMTRDDPLMLNATDEKAVPKIIQRYTLATIFHAMSDSDNTMDVDWMDMDECMSSHIICNEDGFVRELELDDVDARGVIPVEIGLLTDLEHLIIKGNTRLGGVIPKSIKNLSKLRQLALNNNSLVGEVPYEIYSLGNLAYVNLSNNLFHGRLSEKVGLLENLETLVLDNNAFTGKLFPLQLRKTNLSFLSMSGNKMGGSLEPGWGFLRRLKYLYLDQNELVGSVPSQIGLMTKLKSLSLGGNGLNGGIPSEIGSLTNLEYLSLVQNNLTGSIPDSIGNCEMLRRIHLDENIFTGVVPVSMNTLKYLERLSISSNKLNGQASLVLERLHPDLVHLSLSDNDLAGQMGDSFCHLTKLKDFFLDSNNINGTLQDCIGDLTNMNRLLLSGNHLSGSIPPTIGKMTNLVHLGLEGNNLSGLMQDEICAIPTILEIWSDCAGTHPKVTCDETCCTHCCPSNVC